ncbi:MAG TPA: hypothetical protein VM031_02880 [Phycisphaerae bacterium]|nr:hypothetical protein [Phycisphaerae bacterium]
MRRGTGLRRLAGWIMFLWIAVGAPLGARAQIILIPSRFPSEPTEQSKLKVKEAPPANTGPARLICASAYGGKGNDQIVAVRVLPDRSILLAGNLNVGGYDEEERGGEGFLVRLTVQDDQTVAAGPRAMLPGTLNKVKADAAGNVYVLLDNAAVYHIVPGAGEPTKYCVRGDIKDFGVDAGGELVVVHGQEITRYDATWQKEKWTATWHAYGTNTPVGVDVCVDSGVACVIGYGAGHTGRGRWNGPFAHGFDRAGKPLWTLWDQEPKKHLSKKDGGNGLTADTVGSLAKAGPGGKVYLSLYAKDEKTLCTGDPKDSGKALDKGVFDGVYQNNPGKGFQGGSSRRTSVVFRVDPATGGLEKGTWMCAWIKEGQSANPVAMYDVAADQQGRVFVVGCSGFGCPVKDAWYHNEGDYQGDGFLSVFDKDFKMLQSGYFHQTHVHAVDAAYGYVVVGGSVKTGRENSELMLKVHRPIQQGLAGGVTDGYVAVFVTGEHGTPVALPRPGAGPAPDDPAAALLRQARDALAASKPADARAHLQTLLARHPASSQAAEAQTLLKQLEDKPKDPAATPGAGADDDEKAADRLLQKAENFLVNRMSSLARKPLKELITKYPKTEAGKRGQQLWDKHFIDE